MNNSLVPISKYHQRLSTVRCQPTLTGEALSWSSPPPHVWRPAKLPHNAANVSFSKLVPIIGLYHLFWVFQASCKQSVHPLSPQQRVVHLCCAKQHFTLTLSSSIKPVQSLQQQHTVCSAAFRQCRHLNNTTLCQAAFPCRHINSTTLCQVASHQYHPFTPTAPHCPALFCSPSRVRRMYRLVVP